MIGTFSGIGGESRNRRIPMGFGFDGRSLRRTGGPARGRAAAMVLAMLLACSGRAGAQEAQPASPAAPPAFQAPSYRAFARGLGMSFTTSLFSEQNVLPAAIGGTVAVTLAPYDEQISSAVRGTSPTFGTIGETVGGRVVAMSIVGGTITASLFSHSTRFKSTGFALAQATIVELAIVNGLKYATQRERPDGSGNLSFPSGHASDAFTLATVFSHYYGWKWGIPMYAAAGLIAVSRVEHGKHWPSDVAAGATIGLLAGRSGILTTERLSGVRKSSRVTIAPILGAHCWGIAVSVLPDTR
jgi:membrane-associated phospholipid phosphatase